MSEQTPPETIESDEPVNQAAKYLDNEGNFTQSFRDALPDDLGEHSFFKKYTNINDAVKGAINAQQLAGKKAEDFWTSEDPDIVSKRNDIMGIPNSKDGYELKVGKLPKDMPFDEKRVEQFKDFAKEIGLSKQQAAKLIEYDVNAASEMWEASQEERQMAMTEAENVLRKEWKGTKYDYNVAKVSEALEFLELDHLKDNPAYGNNPEFIKAIFDKIVPLIDNDTIIESKQKENYATVNDSLTDIEQRMDKYTGNTNDAVYKNMMNQRLLLLKKLTK